GLARRADVAWAECNDVVALDSVPNDTLWPEQGNLVQIRMPEAWDILASHGVDGTAVNVAFVDNGIVAHPDVSAAILPGFDFTSIPGWDSDPTDTTYSH